MENSPHLVIYWLGLAKIGVISALVNFNQRQGPLLHSLTVASCKAIVCSDSLLEEALQPIRKDLSHVPDSMIFVHCGGKCRSQSDPSDSQPKTNYQQVSMLFYH